MHRRGFIDRSVRDYDQTMEGTQEREKWEEDGVGGENLSTSAHAAVLDMQYTLELRNEASRAAVGGTCISSARIVDF